MDWDIWLKLLDCGWDAKRYAVEFEPRGIKRVLKIAIAFQGKQIALRYQPES